MGGMTPSDPTAVIQRLRMQWDDPIDVDTHETPWGWPHRIPSMLGTRPGWMPPSLAWAGGPGDDRTEEPAIKLGESRD